MSNLRKETGFYNNNNLFILECEYPQLNQCMYIYNDNISNWYGYLQKDIDPGRALCQKQGNNNYYYKENELLKDTEVIFIFLKVKKFNP